MSVFFGSYGSPCLAFVFGLGDNQTSISGYVTVDIRRFSIILDPRER